MNLSSVRQERIRTRRERFQEASRRKRALAETVSAMIMDTAEDDTAAADLRLGFYGPVGRLERFVLRHHPEEIAGKLAVGRSVSLALDESVEPPLLLVTLGEATR